MLSTAAIVAAHAHPWGWGFWFVPVIFWLLIIGLIITFVATRRRRWAAQGWGPYGGPHGAPWASAQAARSAEAVLAERFARGDIEEVEYRARLEVLRSQQPQPPQR